MRKSLFFLFAFLLLFNLDANCDNSNIIVKDVRGEIYEEGAEIIIEANAAFEYLDYTLQNPPQIVVDPMGKVYSDLKDTITFNEGPIKKVMVVRGRDEGGLTGNFYPLDFISIELVKPMPYTISRQNEIIVQIGQVKKAGASELIPLPEPEPEEVEELQEAAEPLPEPPEPKQETPPRQEIPPKQEISPKREPPKQEPPKPEPPKQEPLPEPPAVISQQAAVFAKQEVIPLEAQTEPLPQVEPLLAAAETPAAEEEQVRLIYAIGEGDTLDVSVWQHPDLDRRVVVRPDGYISFPLAGDIRVAGYKPPEVASAIKENLARLIKDPQVTVIVAGFGSKNIFVLGEVDKPGAYLYKGGIKVLDAVSMAGGWKNSAVLNSVMLVRKAFTDAPEAYRLNVYNLIKKGDFSQNLELKAGDIVYVPKSFIANIGGFIENLKISVGAYVTNTTKIFD